jgi:hypothetical protein
MQEKTISCKLKIKVKGEEEKVLFVANAGNYYIVNLLYRKPVDSA